MLSVPLHMKESRNKSEMKASRKLLAFLLDNMIYLVYNRMNVEDCIQLYNGKEIEL